MKTRAKHLWGGEERFQQIKDWLDGFHGQTILEIGIGGGDITAYLSSHNRVCAIDINIGLLRQCALIAPAALVAADARSLPFTNSTFDVVVCREVIEHMTTRDGLLLLAEIRRVLRPGGTLLLSTPNRLSPEGFFATAVLSLIGRKWLAWDPTHVYIYSSFEIKNILQDQGFHICGQRGSNYFSYPLRFIAERSELALMFLKRLGKLIDLTMGRTSCTSYFAFGFEVLCQVP